jgi:hypothetical protein
VHTQKILFYGYRKKIPSAYPQGPKILFGEIGVAGIHHLKDDAIAFIKGKDPSLDDYPSVSYNFLLSERFLKILVVQRWVLCLLKNLEPPLVFIPLLNSAWLTIRNSGKILPFQCHLS